jgi:hypothetical protein
MIVRTLVIVVLATGMSACFDLGWKPELMVSGLRDVSTFSAFPCDDVDGDGVGDIVLNAQDTRDPENPGQPGAWVLSGKDLSPIYGIIPRGDGTPQEGGERLLYAMDGRNVANDVQVEAGDVLASSVDVSKFVAPGFFLIDPHRGVRTPVPRAAPPASAGANGGDAPAAPEPESNVSKNVMWTGWVQGGLISPQEAGWQQADPDPNREKDPLFPSSIRISQAHTDLQNVGACGAVDGDGVLDWSGLSAKPRAVVLVSGSDLSVLRTIPMESRNLATAVTGTFALGDVDRDGVPDWLVGIHVSQSDDHDAPRACRLGLIALVSGGDFHLIKSLERESFLSGSGRQCPVVTLPEAVQP